MPVRGYQGRLPDGAIADDRVGLSIPFEGAFEGTIYQTHSMNHQTLIRCTVCEQTYVVRKRDDGEFILTTKDGRCACGDGTFEELEEGVEG